MSDHIPFEIQSEIIKRLPVKSLVQFRSVSKQWKSLIECPKFIKTYHINHPNPQHHLLVRYNDVPTYTSIVDDKNTFPQQKFPLTAPEPLNSLRSALTLGSVDGLLCYYGFYDVETPMVVIWNPSVGKCVGIVLPDVLQNPLLGYTCFGFGVCPDTNDPKLVKINVVRHPSLCWEVQVFTLSSRLWKTVYTGAPLTSCGFSWDHVCIDGIIYWGSSVGFNTFDLKTEKFNEVCLPEKLEIPSNMNVVKVNESLGLLEFYEVDGLPVCGVWMKKDGVNQPFTRIFTIKVEGNIVSNRNVLGFRNNGDVVLGIVGDEYTNSSVEVYEPSSGHIRGVGIKGNYLTFSASSYVEKLLLLDQPNSIIY